MVIALAVLGLFASAYPRQDARIQPQMTVSRVVATYSPRPTPQKAPAASQTPEPTLKPLATYESRPEPKVPAGSVQARLIKAWPGNDIWALRIVRCETGGTWNPRAHNHSSGADGLWQFIPSTWHRMLDQSGMPSHYSVEYQTKQAWRLYQMAGPSQWACN